MPWPLASGLILDKNGKGKIMENIYADYLKASAKRAKTKHVIEKNDVAYFATYKEAEKHRTKHAILFPKSRVLSFGLGWAVQSRLSGPYFNLDGELK
jgi:hypothetical protein